MGCWWMLLCELDGRVLRGMQFEARVDAALVVPGARGHVWGCWWMLFACNGSWLVCRHDVPTLWCVGVVAP